jgi:YVTN family beta-propeller protein
VVSVPAAGPTTTPAPAPVKTIAGMAPVVDPSNLYSEAMAGRPSGASPDAKHYVYVPSDQNGSVTVIDQATFQVVDTIVTGGKLVQHVVPGYDLKTLYANVSGSNFLREIDPVTGKAGEKIPVDAPYNLYFTPDGSRALVMAERRNRIDVYDRLTWKLLKKVPVPCTSMVRGTNYGGVNHADWSIDGTYFLATCEFAGRMIKVDTATMDVIGTLDLEGAGASRMSMPQDVRITPDGKKFYVADMMNDGLWVVDGDTMTVVKRIETGKGAHGIYPSRDGKVFYVANRGRFYDETDNRRSRAGEGSVSVVDWRTDTVQVTWPIPDGGSPDMGGVSADGKTLWLSGRYDAEVYAIDTSNGQLRARIGTPGSPHGLCVFPQPGRYSLGHTGNYR